MITGPLIITWAVGGAVAASASFWATHMWKKVTHTQAQVAALKTQLEGQKSTEGKSL